MPLAVLRGEHWYEKMVTAGNCLQNLFALFSPLSVLPIICMVRVLEEPGLPTCRVGQRVKQSKAKSGEARHGTTKQYKQAAKTYEIRSFFVETHSVNYQDRLI